MRPFSALTFWNCLGKSIQFETIRFNLFKLQIDASRLARKVATCGDDLEDLRATMAAVKRFMKTLPAKIEEVTPRDGVPIGWMLSYYRDASGKTVTWEKPITPGYVKQEHDYYIGTPTERELRAMRKATAKSHDRESGAA
jgi:hypothetical protein